MVSVKYHKTSHSVGFYISASYERLLKGAEDQELKKPIKPNYGGGIKEFIFDEQEFYLNIEESDLFFTTQEKQSIINEVLNQIVCNTDQNEIVLDGKKVPNGRKLSIMILSKYLC
jgi:anoctamin-8